MKYALSRASRAFDRLFAEGANPLYNLGALSFYLFWIVAVTGLYLFVFFETSIDGAWQSVEWITHEQYFVGSLMRSLHRYASAAMAVSVTLHLLREFVLKRFTGARWFSWVSGVPLLWLLFASAIGGYWLVWDERAEYIALETARLFDALPIITEPIAFGFIDESVVSDRFFSLLIFLHIGIPLALLLGMFIHIKRINHARIMPSRLLSIVILGSLVALSVVLPAVSMNPANLNETLHRVELDWFYMNFYPLIDRPGPAAVWLMLLGITGGLLVVPLLVPLLVPERSRHLAVVDPEYCNGCGWCFADCPYEAIYMKPHETHAGREQAVVIADNCVGCGICAGACPSATPFKTIAEACSGIDLDGMNNFDLLEAVREQVHELPRAERILVVGCAHGTRVDTLADQPGVVTMELECIGQLPPSYMDFLCRRDDVDAVLLTGCSSGDCYHRLGIDIQEQRLRRLREPHLRYPDVREKIGRLWVGRGGEKELEQRVAEIRSQLEVSGDEAA